MFRYSVFIPKLYNFCKSLGFETGKIMPSRAFCSDENQGYPIILITKHFRTFPFNHGQVGGVVATDRHGPHAEHGKDIVIIQASHVGYDPDINKFGVYRRVCTEHNDISASCGKIENVILWYEDEYQFAMNNIFLIRKDGQYLVDIDNQLLDESRQQGLFLDLEQLVATENGQYNPVQIHSTSKYFPASEKIKHLFDGAERKAIGRNLLPEFFYFKREIIGDLEGRSHLEQNLIKVMPWVVTADAPLLTAAKINSQVEFDRAFRTIVKARGYKGKRLIYISGLNIDISPQQDMLFPLTKFVPWAAYIQYEDGSKKTMEQDELFAVLNQQSTENPDQIDMEDAIEIMEHVKEVKVKV